MALTIATFATNLLAMSVTGIDRTVSNPPQHINATDEYWAVVATVEGSN